LRRQAERSFILVVILKKSPVSQLAVRAYSAAGRMRPQLEPRAAQEAVIDAD
jgi:hypothetical protein